MHLYCRIKSLRQNMISDLQDWIRFPWKTDYTEFLTLCWQYATSSFMLHSKIVRWCKTMHIKIMKKMYTVQIIQNISSLNNVISFKCPYPKCCTEKIALCTHNSSPSFIRQSLGPTKALLSCSVLPLELVSISLPYLSVIMFPDKVTVLPIMKIQYIWLITKSAFKTLSKRANLMFLF